MNNYPRPLQADVMTYDDFTIAHEKPADVTQAEWELWDNILYSVKLPQGVRRPKTLIVGGLRLMLVEDEDAEIDAIMHGQEVQE